MPHVDVLYELMKTLKKGEKRYFNVYSERNSGEENNALKLFELIDQKKVFNDDKLKDLLGEGTLAANFNFNKHRLYESILKSLQLFYWRSTTESELFALLQQADILFERKLLAQSSKILQKTKKLAVRYEILPVQVLIAQRQIKIFRAKKYATVSEREVNMFFYEYVTVSERIAHLSYLHRSLLMLIFYAFQRGFSRTPKELAFYKNYLKDPILKHDTSRYGFWEWYYHLNIYIATYSVCEDYTNAYKYTLQMYELMKKYKYMISENPQIAIATMGNMVLGQMKAKQFKQLDVTVKEFKSLVQLYDIKGENYKEEIFYNSRQFELQYLMTTAQVGRAMGVIDEIETHGYQRNQLMLNFGIMATAFAGLDYVRATKYALEIINSDYGIRTDLVCFARLYRLVMLIETGRLDQIDYATRGALKQLQKENRSYKIELAVIDFIQNTLQYCSSRKEEIKMFKLFRSELSKLFKTDLDKRALLYFDILVWVNSKIEGKTYAQKLKEQVRL